MPIETTPAVEFCNLTFGYSKDNLVLQNLNLKILPGEKVGIVGRSGAGKSTLVKLLLKFFSPQTGCIKIGEQDISNASDDSVREFIGIMPQDPALFHRSLAQNITISKKDFVSKNELLAASQKAHVNDFILSQPDQYETVVGDRGLKLSGGQRQRISIARAILKNAPILVLDEATSALDSETEKFIQESLSFFINDRKKTVIAIAHRLSTLKHMDRIVVLDQGRIVEEGSHDELINNDQSLYKKLWDLQQI